MKFGLSAATGGVAARAPGPKSPDHGGRPKRFIEQGSRLSRSVSESLGHRRGGPKACVHNDTGDGFARNPTAHRRRCGGVGPGCRFSSHWRRRGAGASRHRRAGVAGGRVRPLEIRRGDKRSQEPCDAGVGRAPTCLRAVGQAVRCQPARLSSGGLCLDQGIGQLVGVLRSRRKVLREETAATLDGGHQPPARVSHLHA